MKMNDYNYLCSKMISKRLFRRSHENKFNLKINFKRHSRDCKYDVFNYKNGFYENIIL